MSEVKCSRRENVFCGAMEEFADDQYGTGKRIFIAGTVMSRDGKEKNPRPAYQFNRKSNGFIWLNFCPWCGGDVK